MIKLHIRCGEYIYFSERSSGLVVFKILLVEFNEKANTIEIGVFDFTQNTERQPEMEIVKLNFGERMNLFHHRVSLNGLKAEYQGVNFAVSATPSYLIDNDFLRRKKTHAVTAKQGTNLG